MGRERGWGWETTVALSYMAVPVQKVQTFHSLGAAERTQDQWEKAIRRQILLQPKKELSRTRTLQEIVRTYSHRINDGDAEDLWTPGSESHKPLILKLKKKIWDQPKFNPKQRGKHLLTSPSQERIYQSHFKKEKKSRRIDHDLCLQFLFP